MYNRRMIKSFPWMKGCVVVLLFMTAVAGWHLVDNRPSSMDETKHMQLAMDSRDGALHDVPLQNPWAHVYPPLYHVSIIPALSLGVPSRGKSGDDAYVVRAHFCVRLLAAWAARTGDRRTERSLAAALIVLGYAYVLWTGRRALTDFPLLAWTTFSMALLARTRGFESRKASLLWGVSAGIGMLLKFTFAFFFVLPVLCTFVRSRSAERVKNMTLALGVAVLVGGFWYFWNSAYFFDKAFGLVKEVTSSGTDPRTLAGWLFYVKLWRTQLGIPQLIFYGSQGGLRCVWCPMIAVLSRRRRTNEGGRSIVDVRFLSGYLVLSAMMNKDPRHTLPLLPAVALLAVRGMGVHYCLTLLA